MAKFNIPRWQLPDKVKQRKNEIDEFTEKILSAAFKKIKGQEANKIDLQKIRIHNPRSRHPQYFTIKKTDPEMIKEMVGLIAEKAWDHLYETDPNEFFSSVKENIEEKLEEIKSYLEGFADKKQRTRLFDKKSVDKAYKILSESAYSRLDKQKKDLKNMSGLVKEQVRIQPRSPKYIVRENRLISKIQNIYKTYIPEQKTQDHIIYFASLVFKVCDLWENVNHYETMKKRFQKKL